eukprot:IDg19431t1
MSSVQARSLDRANFISAPARFVGTMPPRARCAPHGLSGDAEFKDEQVWRYGRRSDSNIFAFDLQLRLPYLCRFNGLAAASRRRQLRREND